MISPLILALPYAKGRYMVDTVAYDVHVGYTLLQEEPDRTVKPVGHGSRSPTKTEKASNITQ